MKNDYHREHYTALFDYLDSQISKEAENILLEYEDEQRNNLAHGRQR